VDLRDWEGDSTLWRGSMLKSDLLAAIVREEWIKMGVQAFWLEREWKNEKISAKCEWF